MTLFTDGRKADPAHVRRPFEDGEGFVTPEDGGLNGLEVAPPRARGWRTHNFEVEGTHTYIADGVRVHNRSDVYQNEYGQTIHATSDGRVENWTALETGGDARDMDGDGDYDKKDVDFAYQAGLDKTERDYLKASSFNDDNAQIAMIDRDRIQSNLRDWYQTESTQVPNGTSGSATVPGFSSDAHGAEVTTARREEIANSTKSVHTDPDYSDGFTSDENWSSIDTYGYPVVLDTNGDGVVTLTSAGSGATFDIDGDGFLEHTGWVGGGDGILVYDHNGDGQINLADEIDLTRHAPGTVTDFQGLATFDSNGDGVFDGRDAEGSKFKVFIDANGDGKVDPGELKTLAEAGVGSIDLTSWTSGSDPSTTPDDAGNIVQGTATFTKLDGTTGVVGDVAFKASVNGFKVETEADGTVTVTTQIDQSAGSTFSLGTKDLVFAGVNTTRISWEFDEGSGSGVQTGGDGDDTIDGTDGSDTVASGGGDDTVNTGGGDDTVDSGSGDDSVNTGDGNDTVTAGDGNDTVNGGAGDDQIYGEGGNDWLGGGAGNDWINGGSGHDTLVGGDGADSLHGDTGNDLLDGGAGDDDLHGGFGNDTAYGGDGNDKLILGPGNNQGFGGAGADTITGSFGNDEFYGGPDNDTLSGNGGNDTLGGGADHDQVFGGSGRDILYGGGGHDDLYGGTGQDTLYGGTGEDEAYGGADDDHIEAGDGNDTLGGGTGNDSLYGQNGNDALYGGDGNDTLNGDSGADRLEGGTGADVIGGGSGDDTVLAGEGADSVDGGDGEDDLLGGGGNDTVTGGLGRDVLVGEAGDDDLDGGGDADALYGGDGADVLKGGAGDDHLEDGAGSDTVLAGDGNDMVVGSDGDDALDGGTGTDRLDYRGAATAVVVDLGAGSAQGTDIGADTLSGFEIVATGSGDDALTGDGGDNGLYGNAGADTLDGGLGNDTLDGGAGSDTLKGGLGDDLYVETLLDGAQVIEDEGGTDALYLKGVLADAVVVSSDVDDVVMTIGDGSITIRGHLGAAGLVLEEILFDDGTVWTGDELKTKALTPPDDPDAGGGSGGGGAGGGTTGPFLATADAETFAGGTGLDTVSYEAAGAAVTVDLAYASNNTGDALGDSYVSIEVVWGSGFDDFLGGTDEANGLVGNAGHDMIFARGGDDTLEGGSGDDLLQGGLGADVIDGGDGWDAAVYWHASAGVTAELEWSANNAGEAAGDTYVSIEMLQGSTHDDFLGGNDEANGLYGNAGHDMIFGRGGDDDLYGEDGDDLLQGGLGADIIDGGAGWDAAIYWHAASGVKADLTDAAQNWGEAAGDTYSSIEMLQGSVHDDVLVGEGGDNALYGNAGSDLLYGLGGDDLVHGEDGDDLVDGGAGNDLLYGGSGADVFVWVAGTDNDLVADFSIAQGDVLRLEGTGYSSFTDLVNAGALGEQNGSAYVAFASDQGITLENVALADLTASQFVFT